MTEPRRLAAWIFALVALFLAVAVNPLVAGYVFAGVAFAVILALMGMRVARAIDEWSLEHLPTLRHRTQSR